VLRENRNWNLHRNRSANCQMLLRFFCDLYLKFIIEIIQFRMGEWFGDVK
jgi:hypothetical protein